MIRTVEDLSDTLAAELAWRRKEIAALKSIIDAAQHAKHRDAVIRGGVALLYAHWEGFIKVSASAYLEYVAVRRLKYAELSINFVALAIRPRLIDAARRDDAGLQTELVRILVEQRNERAAISFKEGVDTKSNLSYEVLRNLMNGLGLDYRSFETKQKLIDEKLLARRNNIAHGRYLPVSVAEYNELHRHVAEMLADFKNIVENAAVESKYRAA